MIPFLPSILILLLNAIIRNTRPGMSEGEVADAFDDLAEQRVAGQTLPLDWRNSVVDLLKLLDLDASLEARAAMAKGFGYEREFTGSAADNRWLYDRVRERVAAHEIALPPGQDQRPPA